jgi:hypothetical protein
MRRSCREKSDGYHRRHDVDIGGSRVIWLAGAGSLLLLVLAVVGLADLARNRRTMETAQVVIWAIVIILLPVIGLVSYLLWRIARSDAMVDSMDFQDKHSAKGNAYPPVGR